MQIWNSHGLDTGGAHKCQGKPYEAGGDLGSHGEGLGFHGDVWCGPQEGCWDLGSTDSGTYLELHGLGHSGGETCIKKGRGKVGGYVWASRYSCGVCMGSMGDERTGRGCLWGCVGDGKL